jgi:membrane-associated protease RseP (regulator of RpoE activity)
LKFDAISLLNPVRVEQILIVCGIGEGLVVREVHIACCCFPEFACFGVHTSLTVPQVSGDSPAEKCGIRIGDVIECLNGKSISTTVEVSALCAYYC